MDIKGRSVLVLGGGGLVGSAVCRKLVEESPRRIIVTALTRREAQEAVRALRKEFPRHAGRDFFVPWWGNIFVRHQLKDTPRGDVIGNAAKRSLLIADMLQELNEAVLHRSTIYRLIAKFKPNVIIDCINSATAIAYQDLFQSARSLLRTVSTQGKNIAATKEAAEQLVCTLYMPQLIRHVQLLYRSMHESKTGVYVKIGTSGTGGMGLNIPYTHSEERPSSVLLSKSAVAGAHTLLLFLMGRTPDAPITKEIKPTAAIAWRRVAYGEVMRRGKPIALYDCPPAKAAKLEKTLSTRPNGTSRPLHATLKSVFIDTGENGLFSRGEFEAISTPGQMEFVTPEEIAEAAIYEIRGGNTGHDIINALDNATLSPTYRAGYMFQSARRQIELLERQHGIDSVAFENLGPPRLSKLLYEAYLLKLAFTDMRTVTRKSPKELSEALRSRIESDRELRSRIISIGIPILLPDGKRLLRGPDIKIPAHRGEREFPVSAQAIDLWAHDGWVDLRVGNMQRWKKRFAKIGAMVRDIPAGNSGSQFIHTSAYWENFTTIDPGKLAGWIFSYEDRGMRMKP